MDSATVTGGNLLRLIGIMGVAVGLAWALQIVVFGGEGATAARMLWVLAAAAISGAGVGLMMVSGQLPESGTMAVEA